MTAGGCRQGREKPRGELLSMTYLIITIAAGFLELRGDDEVGFVN